jgi:hypothetical protein
VRRGATRWDSRVNSVEGGGRCFAPREQMKSPGNSDFFYHSLCFSLTRPVLLQRAYVRALLRCSARLLAYTHTKRERERESARSNSSNSSSRGELDSLTRSLTHLRAYARRMYAYTERERERGSLQRRTQSRVKERPPLCRPSLSRRRSSARSPSAARHPVPFHGLPCPPRRGGE